MELYPWQKKVIEESVRYPKRALFAAPRLGKTLATTTMMANLIPGENSLVVAPLSVCGVWKGELEQQGIRSQPLYLASLVEAASALYEGVDGAVILNYDKLPDLLFALKKWKPQGLVFDESHLLKNPQSARSKAARRLATSPTFLRILTGTPSPNHYGDLWAQMTLVHPEVWGRTWTPFAQRYLIRDAIYPSKIIGHNNVPELRGMLNADADIVRREDVFGPDTWQVVERMVDLPEGARKAYDTLVKEWLLYHEQAGEVSVDHTLKRLVRLQQLCSGYLRNEEGQDYQMHSAKIDAVLADLDEIVESEEKAVIFHRFTWEGDHLAEAIQRRFPHVPVFKMDGNTSSSNRTAGEAGIRDCPTSAIMVAQTRTAALGISFAEATHALFVSQSFSFVDEEQARDRVYKPGVNRCVTYYRCVGTVDEFIAKVIANKTGIHDAVTHADIREMSYGFLRR